MSQAKQRSILTIVEKLDDAYPEAHLELDFNTPFELLIATILAAQSTDERINRVTRQVFVKYPSPEAYLKVDVGELETDIRSTGFYRNKAKNIVGCCRALVANHGGIVPQKIEDLLKLPGVGRKTANIVLANALSIPAIGVDTHTIRVPNRLGLVDTTNADKVEAELCELLPRRAWHRANILLQWHGRYTCKAKKPLCDQCVLFDICKWKDKLTYG